MRTSAYIDEKVFEKIYDLLSKSNNPILSAKLIKFLVNTDCYIPPGYWQKHKMHQEITRRLTAKGRVLHPIRKEDFFKLVENSNHFTLAVTNDESHKSITKPVYSINEITELMENSDSTSYYVRDKMAVEDFIKASLTHNPSSIVINDRYFYKKGNPSIKMGCILGNILSPDFSSDVVVTLFYSAMEGGHYDPQIYHEEMEQACLLWPKANFYLEKIQNRFHNSNHDRFIITDLLRYRSSTSFDFLTDNKCSTIDRYAIYDCPEFNIQLVHFTTFLAHSNISELKKSKNGIIASYLREHN